MNSKDLSLTELPSTLDSVYQYWRGLGGEKLECSWAIFKLESLPARVLPLTMVIDVKPDLTQNEFRFWGTAMTRIHGMDLTGKTTSQLTPADFRENVQQGHAMVIRNPVADARVVGFERQGGFDHMQTILRLPLSNDGITVAQIVVTIESTEEGNAALLEKDLRNTGLWEDTNEA